MSKKGENITKRKDGRWEARVIKGRDCSGKAKYKYLYAFSYQDVRQKKNDYIKMSMQLIILNRSPIYA